jgi:prepilin-type N-terminal cleavage/methylation domain-containing protein/prepilin-type processing-associated H-X9-DG protein
MFRKETKMKKGFTLIELLVVIAIIAVLMGILMPALSMARKQGQQAVCQSNLRQTGLAASMYADDNEHKVPRGTGGGKNILWFQVFLPYLAHDKDKKDYRDVESFRCPSHPDKHQTVCYVVNGWGFENEVDKIGFEVANLTVKLINYRHLSKTIYLADNEDGPWREIIEGTDSPGLAKCDVWSREHMPSSNSLTSNRSRRVARDRHRKAFNALYADWHVERVSTINTLPEQDAIDQELEMWRFRKR